MTAPLPRSAPEALGIDSRRLLDLFTAVDRTIHEPHSLMILRHGQVAAEAWWSPYSADRRHLLFSLTKSFTATAVGLAVGDGLVGLDDRVVKYFPGVAPARPSRRLAALTVRHLLTMSTGRLTDSSLDAFGDRTGDWVRGFFRRPWLQAPGEPFVYDTGASHVLGALVATVTGQDLAAFLQTRLFGPLGITDWAWETDPKGRRTGGFGLSLKTEDVAKFGQLLLQDGVWEGRRLLPAGWVAQATALQVVNDRFAPSDAPDWRQGYGFQFWRCRHGGFRGDGAFGQFCVVLPDQKTVVAATGATASMQPLLDLLWSHLLPALEPGPLPAAPAAARALGLALGGMNLPVPDGGAFSDLEGPVSARRYALEANAEGWTDLRLTFAGEVLTLELTDDRGRFTLKAGRRTWHEEPSAALAPPRSLDPRPAPRTLVLVSAFAWSGPRTLTLVCRSIEEPFVRTLVLAFEDGRIRIEQNLNVGFGPTGLPRVVGVGRKARS